MNELRNRNISERTLLTTYDDEFNLKSKECLMFIETTGLKPYNSQLTLVSITYNKNGNGHILQVFNYDRDEEETISEAAKYLKKFNKIVIVNKWFETYYNEKLNQCDKNVKLSFENINVRMKVLYKYFDSSIDINKEAVKSISVYEQATNTRNPKIIKKYLSYNRNHSIAYALWEKLCDEQ